MTSKSIRKVTGGVAAAAVLAGLFAAPVLRAHLMQIFTVEVAWSASNIVVVRETDQPGRFKVINSWKGVLPRDSVIDVPDMVPLQSGPDRSLNGKKELKIQTSRLVLFLQLQLAPAADGKRWLPANASKEAESRMKTSMAWLQDSRTICFRPDGNESALVLQECGMSEFQLMAAVRSIDHEQTLLESIHELPDKRARAEELAPFITSQYRSARSYAFRELEACGKDAIPTLLAILRDPALLDQHGDAIKDLVSIQGQRAGPELTALLDSDVRFWTDLRPTLKPGWWYQNNDGSPLAYLPLRYSHTIDLIRALGDLKYAEARDTVIALRDLWQSFPPMDIRDGNSENFRGDEEMIRECASVLNRLPNR
jgi:hypothetical protein